MENTRNLKTLLKRIGLTSTNTGSYYFRYAIQLVLEDETYLSHMTKRLYPDIAAHFNTSAGAVERCMRVFKNAYWHKHQNKKLEKVTGYYFMHRPTTGEFIATIADYLHHC